MFTPWKYQLILETCQFTSVSLNCFMKRVTEEISNFFCIHLNLLLGFECIDRNLFLRTLVWIALQPGCPNLKLSLYFRITQYFSQDEWQRFCSLSPAITVISLIEPVRIDQITFWVCVNASTLITRSENTKRKEAELWVYFMYHFGSINLSSSTTVLIIPLRLTTTSGAIHFRKVCLWGSTGILAMMYSANYPLD